MNKISEPVTENGHAAGLVPDANALPATRDIKSNVHVQRGLDNWHVVRIALINAAQKRDASGTRAVQRMADRVMTKAIEGNMEAVKFVTERIDGKVVTPIDVKQDITVSSIGEAHLHALQRLTDAVARHDQAKIVEHSEPDKPDTDPKTQDSG